MDEYYSIRLSGEVKRGMAQKALQGGYQGRMPLGYHKQGFAIPSVVNDEALLVKRIFNMYIEKNGHPSDIAIILNKEGIRNKQGHIFDAKKINYKKLEISETDSETASLIKLELAKLDSREKRIKEAYINGIDSIEEYKENKLAMQKQRDFLNSQLEKAMSCIQNIATADYEENIRKSLDNVIQMIENRPDAYIDIGTALNEHVSKIVYNKKEDHMIFYP